MIQVEALVKTFPKPDGGVVVAVDHLTFEVRPREIFGLLGPNGAGKTTTLRILSGLLKPTSGHVWLAGHDVVADPVGIKRSIGFLTASTGLYQRLSPREVLAYFAELHGLRGRALRARVDELIHWLGMEDFAHLRCGALSTGQRQRTSIARALVADPPVLVLDEPTLGLDVMTNRVILDFVRQQRDAGKTILLSTHYLDEAERLCDRIGLLHRGRLIADGDLAALRAQSGCERLTEIFLSLVAADHEPAGPDPHSPQEAPCA